MTVFLALTNAGVAAQRPPPLVDLERRAVADSNDPGAHYQLAISYWDRKKWDEAERALRQATTLAPSYAEGWLALAMLPEMRGERYWKRFADQRGTPALDSVLQQAVLFYRRAFLTNPLVDLAVLGRYRTPPPAITDSRGRAALVFWWQGDFEKGVNDLRQSRNEEAFQRFEKILKDRRAGNDRRTVPWSILWHHGLAAARTGRYDDAINDFAFLTGRARAQENAEPDNSLTASFLQALGYQTDRGLQMHTNDFRYILATMYFLGGQLELATAVFRRALEFDIGLYQAHVQLARIFEAQQLWESAIKARQDAIAVNPDDPALLIDLGGTLARGGKLDEAHETLLLAFEQSPRNPRAAYSLALVALQRNDAATARMGFSRFLDIAPTSDSPLIAEARRRLAELPAE